MIDDPARLMKSVQDLRAPALSGRTGLCNPESDFRISAGKGFAITKTRPPGEISAEFKSFCALSGRPGLFSLIK